MPIHPKVVVDDILPWGYTGVNELKPSKLIKEIQMITLTGNWQSIEFTGYGDILARNDGSRILVSFPEDLSEQDVRDALLRQGINIGDVVFESGEEEGETVAFFSKP